MERNRIQKAIAQVRLYTYKKKQAAQKMIEGDLNSYLDSLKDAYETQSKLKEVF